MSEAISWSKGSRILIILAHPDDPEFFMGGTIASWTAAGHHVKYALLTNGERGVSAEFPDSTALALLRRDEQKAAAHVLGVEEIDWLGYPDGFLEADLASRKVLAGFIRAEKPDIVVTSDPLNYFQGGRYLNHPDHRTAGQMVVNALFPAVGNASFFPELIEEGLAPHQVSELWLSLPSAPNVELDVSPFWDKRAEALLQHRSQIGEPQAFLQHLKERLAESDHNSGRYVEYFHRLVFRK